MSAFPKNYNFTDLENLVENHPNWEWDMHWLSFNPSITPEFIERHPTGLQCGKDGGMEGGGWEPWNMFNLSENPSITSEFVENIRIGNGVCTICLKTRLSNRNLSKDVRPAWPVGFGAWKNCL
jgi:hypothetical protein